MNKRFNNTPLEIITDQVNQGIIKGAVVMAGLDDNVVYSNAYGEGRDGIEMQLDSIFDIASITKPLATASSCAICMDHGLLDFDESLIYYFPECHDRINHSVTIRQLATHTSGLDFKNFTDKTETPEEIFSTVYQKNKPNTVWNYSCMEYILLGLLVERLTNQRLDQFCMENIFMKANMTETCFGPINCTERVSEPISSVSTASGPGQISDFNAYFMSQKKRSIGNAGVFSTAKDLSIFCKLLLNRKNPIFSETALKELTTNNITSPHIPPHAFGWDMNPVFYPRHMSRGTIYHSGWTGNTVWIDPKQKSWLIVLTVRHGDYDKAKQGRLDIANTFNDQDTLF